MGKRIYSDTMRYLIKNVICIMLRMKIIFFEKYDRGKPYKHLDLPGI